MCFWHFPNLNVSPAADGKPAQAVWSPVRAGEGVQGVPQAGGSLQGLRAAEGLLRPPERLHPAPAASPRPLQADPGAPVQTLRRYSRGLQGLQRCDTLPLFIGLEQQNNPTDDIQSYLWVFLCSCSGWCVWGGGAAPGKFNQDGELPEASGVEEGFDWHWQSCCSWSGELRKFDSVSDFQTSTYMFRDSTTLWAHIIWTNMLWAAGPWLDFSWFRQLTQPSSNHI